MLSLVAFANRTQGHFPVEGAVTRDGSQENGSLRSERPIEREGVEF